MKIGLDLDGTVYAHPQFFAELIGALHPRGHRFFCISSHGRWEWDVGGDAGDNDLTRLRKLGVPADLIDTSLMHSDRHGDLRIKGQAASHCDLVFDDDLRLKDFTTAAVFAPTAISRAKSADRIAPPPSSPSLRMKLEIGGGDKPRGDGWKNVDCLPGADVVHDLNVLPWPFADESIDELYSSHCLEHLAYQTGGAFAATRIFREIARICKVGASIEIRVPDSQSEMAMCPGHTTVLSINTFRHFDIFPREHWAGSPRRMKLLRVEPGCDDHWFHEARKNPLFKSWSDEDLLTWLPRTRHENRFHLTVEKCDL